MLCYLFITFDFFSEYVTTDLPHRHTHSHTHFIPNKPVRYVINYNYVYFQHYVFYLYSTKYMYMYV